jgi:hypothetical protein
MLRLSQVAWVLGVNEKTADNAIRTLGLPRPLARGRPRSTHGSTCPRSRTWNCRLSSTPARFVIPRF